LALPEGTPDGGFELRHVADREASPGMLAVHEDPREAREISKLTEGGEYRPLKSSPNLRRGWLLRVPNEAGLGVAMNYLYPAGVVHWHLRREGRLEVTHYRENAARQSGIIVIVSGFFELPHALSQAAHHLRQLGAAEQQQHENQHDQKLRCAQSKHGVNSFGNRSRNSPLQRSISSKASKASKERMRALARARICALVHEYSPGPLRQQPKAQPKAQPEQDGARLSAARFQTLSCCPL
jgi:hypothetical protein